MRKDIIFGRLPDVFAFTDGGRVLNLSDWDRRRREILKDVIEIEFGGMPPEPESFECEPIDVMGARYHSTYRLHCGTKNYPFSFILKIWRPDCRHKCPVVLTGDEMYDSNLDDAVIAEARSRGFAVAKFSRVELASDIKEAGRSGGIYPLWPDMHFTAISAWAWGYHRAVDALMQMDFIDTSRIAITGHSRGGKTVLLAGATDERIKFVNPNDSGTHGCGCYRFTQVEDDGCYTTETSETLSIMLKRFPHWMGEGLYKYGDKEAELPYDMHFIKALVAPRYLLETNAYGDIWGNPRGSYLTHLAAKEVWKMHGCEDRCLTHYRFGEHAQRFDDFCVLFGLIDAERVGANLPDYFRHVPYTDMQPLHDWKCPE
ncbi:MAG: acetylxylan esterase [Clostridia bacterium]|nr:acetylxylan esterase [Clostridia bacterium]